VGLGIGVAYVLATGLIHAMSPALGFPDTLIFTPSVAFLSVLINGALLGGFPTANAYLHRGVAADFAALRPCLDGADEEVEALARETASPPAPHLRWIGLLAAIGGVANALFDPYLQHVYGELSHWAPQYLWFLAHNAAFAFLGARLVVTEIHMTRAYARVGAEAITPDLLDLRPLAAFGRKSQRSVVAWVLLSSVFSLFWVLESASEINFLVAMIQLLLVPAAFLLPAVGVRKSIRTAKAAELDRIRERLRTERERILDPEPGKRSGDGGLSDLISYRKLIEAAPEWPFDATVVFRVLLFAGLGVGSWLGGAVVERLLDSLLS
jgi:hypothetical protein